MIRRGGNAAKAKYLAHQALTQANEGDRDKIQAMLIAAIEYADKGDVDISGEILEVQTLLAQRGDEGLDGHVQEYMGRMEGRNERESRYHSDWSTPTDNEENLNDGWDDVRVGLTSAAVYLGLRHIIRGR